MQVKVPTIVYDETGFSESMDVVNADTETDVEGDQSDKDDDNHGR